MHKILFYTDTPLLGGAENQMLLLAKFLPREKYAVTLACSSSKALNQWCQNFIEMDLPVIRLDVLGKHDPRHLLYLKQILPKFDLCHMHVWNPASGRYGFLAASKIPLIITEHDPFVLKGLRGWFKKKLIKKAKKIIVASKAAKEQVVLQDESLESITTIVPNGIDVENWKSQARIQNRNEFRKMHLKAGPNEKVIICVAELHERKGQKYLIEAVEKNQNIKLVFVGDGPARNHYEKLAKRLEEKVVFLGRKKEVAKLMAAADLFVLPSIREAFGLVVLEASAVGLPVVASGVGGIREIIEDGKTGVLVKPADSKALAEAIDKVLLNPTQTQSMAHAAQNRVEILFNARKMAERTAEVYDNILNLKP